MVRQLALAAALAVVMANGTAQIPVTDGASIANNIASHVESLAKYAEQIAQMKAQLDQAKQLYNQLNGLRDVGGLMNDKLLQQYLPPDYQAAYNALRNGKAGSLSGISGSLNDILKMYQARDCGQYGAAAVQARCRADWQDRSMQQYVGETGYQQAARNIQDLQAFVDRIKGTPDAKALQDLQARIAVEQVKLQNEQWKLNAVAQMQKAQEEMKRTNAIDNTVKSMKPGMIHF